jgi:ATP-dependent helicase/nuclease subunit A
VGTIHSFATDLLRRRPAESGVDPGFAVADELGMRLLFAEAWEEFLRSLAASGDPGLDVAADLGLETEPDLRAAAGVVFRAARAGQRPAPQPSDVRALAEQSEILALLERAREQAFPGGSLARDLDEKLPIHRALASLTEREAVRRWLSLKRAPALPRRNLGSAKAELVAKRLKDEALDRCKALRLALAGDRLTRLFDWLAPLADRYDRLAREQGKLDFDALLEKALAVVRRDPEVVRDFRRQYRVVLVDEFQDTDPVQTDLLLALFGDAGGDEEDAHGRCLFVVGDPKQSIYRFRGADVENYRKVRERPGTQTLLLRRTFRPVPELAAWTNRVLGRVMAPRSLELDPEAIEYQPLEVDPPPAAMGAPRGVVYLELERPADGRVQPVREVEARALARWARGYVEGEGPERTVRGEDGVPRPPRYGDLALILPKLTQFEPYEKELQREGVPYRVEAGRHYYRRDEIHALVQILTLLADPGDSVAALAVLRGPGFGCSDDELLAYALLDPPRRFDLAPGEASAPAAGGPDRGRAERVVEALDRLRALRHEVEGLPLPELVAAVIERLGLIPLFALRSYGEQRVGNLRKAAEVARRMAAQGVESLPAIVRALAALYDQEIPEADAFVHEGPGDALRVLTVHAAKGLEFPVVLLGDLAGQAGGPLDRLRIVRGEMKLGKDSDVATAGYESVSGEEERRESCEDQRKLYVAVTRARDLLVIPHLDRAFKSKLSPLFTQLFEHGGGRPNEIAELDGITVVDAATLVAREAVAEAGLELDRLGAASAASVLDRRASALAAVRARLVSGAGLVRPSAVEAEETGEFSPDAGPDDAGPEAGERRRIALRVGDAAHQMIAAALSERGLESVSFAAEVEAAARPLAQTFLSSALGARVGRVRPAERWVEQALALSTGAALLDARLDLAFVEEDEWVIVDFKSDRVEPSRVPARAARYAPQLGLYAAGLERLSGRRVRAAHLFFMHPGVDHPIIGADLERERAEAERRLGGQR